MNLNRQMFNEAFGATMNQTGLKGKDLAEASGRTPSNISNIRKGNSFPTIGDFSELIMVAESLRPGFFEDFARRLIGESRRLTVSPEEIIEALDSSEFGALMIAAGRRMCEKGTHKEDSPAYQKIAS